MTDLEKNRLDFVKYFLRINEDIDIYDKQIMAQMKAAEAALLAAGIESNSMAASVEPIASLVNLTIAAHTAMQFEWDVDKALLDKIYHENLMSLKGLLQ